MKKICSGIKKNKGLLLLATPGLLWLLIFAYLPMFGVIIAFKDFKIFKGGFLNSLFKSEWVGWRNFEFLFASSDTSLILRNTLLYNFVFIILGTLIPIGIAIALHELLHRKVAKFYQSVMFFPYFLSWVVVSYFVVAFLDPTKGLVNGYRVDHSLEFINFYLEPKFWPGILIFLNTWKGLGYGTILYLGTLAGIDRSYYQVALIEGATFWQMLRYITLPLLKPVVTILVVLSISKMLNSDFGLFYQVPKNSGALFNVTQTLDTYVYRALTTAGNIGMSSATALFQSTVGFILVIIANQAIRKLDSENSLF